MYPSNEETVEFRNDSVLTLLFTSGIVIGTAVAATNSYRMMYCGGACSRNKVARYKANNRRKELWEHARALVQSRRKKKRTRTRV